MASLWGNMALSKYAKLAFWRRLLSPWLSKKCSLLASFLISFNKMFLPFFNIIFIILVFFSTAIIRDVVQRRFEVYHKLEEAARLAVEQEAAAKAAEERKKAEEIAAKAAAEEAKAQAAEQGEQESEADGRETADKPDEDSTAGEEPAPSVVTPAESVPKDPEPADDAEVEQE